MKKIMMIADDNYKPTSWREKITMTTEAEETMLSCPFKVISFLLLDLNIGSLGMS